MSLLFIIMSVLLIKIVSKVILHKRVTPVSRRLITFKLALCTDSSPCIYPKW